MLNYYIRPRVYMGEKYIMHYIDYTKREAIKRYLSKFPNLKRKDIIVY